MPTTIAVGSRSLFVTATAWIFMCLAVAACASALVQHAMLGSWLTVPVRSGFTGFLLGHVHWVVALGLVMSLATLVSAAGLLVRLDWARRTFIGLLAVAIVANLLGLWLQQEMMQSVVSSTLHRTSLPPQAAEVVGGFVTAVRVMAVVVTLGGCALLGWIMRRLMSAGVRREFA